MEFDLDYFVESAIEDGRYNPSLINPCSNLAVGYGDSILKAARQHGSAQVEGLKVEVDDLDSFQYFYIDDEEVTASQWQQALLELLTKGFAEKAKVTG